jgi:site-specific recombinase XerD
MRLLLRDLVEQFYAYMIGRNAPGTIDYYRRHIERFVAAHGNIEVRKFKKHHLATWSQKWHAIQAVQRLFAWAHTDMELIDRNPFKTVKRPRLGGRKRVLAIAEIACLMRNSDACFRRVLVALRESIARPQEIRALRWELIRWEGQAVTLLEAIAKGEAYFELWEYKSRKQRLDPDVSRVIFINEKFGRLLLWLAKRTQVLRGPIFVNRRGEAWTSNALRLRVRRLCKRADVVEDGRGERIVAYSFRHTSATNACASGMPDRVLADLMGHTSTRTTARYQHLSRKHLRDAVKKLENDNKNGKK